MENHTVHVNKDSRLFRGNGCILFLAEILVYSVNRKFQLYLVKFVYK